MSEYMGKKINAFLLIMIILVLLGMGGLSIYYQRTFKDVNSQYEEVSSTLQSCQVNLATTTLTLTNVQQSLNSTESDIRKYDTLYEQKSSELENIKDDLKTTQATLQKETIFKQRFQKKAEDYYAQIQTLNKNITAYQSQVKVLETSITNLENEVDCLYDEPDAMELSIC